MTPNAQTVTDYMDGFRRTDRPAILACLTDDVEWEIPGFFKIQGRAAFDKHIEDDAFVGRPEITVTRLIEEGDVVVAEGSVRTQRKEGTVMRLAFCDVFELRDGKIRRLVSYLVELKDARPVV